MQGVCLIIVINMISQSSQRQLLINRARNFQLCKRLKNNLQEIQQKTERLSHSRCSSISSQSRRSQRLNYSMQGRQKSPKVKMLQSIVDKLKCPKLVIDRKSQISTQDNILREDFRHMLQTKQNDIKIQVERKVQKPIESSPTRHKNKLQAMLKGIKRCNQQSTKAVSSIKKGFPKLNPQSIKNQPPLFSQNQSKQALIKQQMNNQLTEVISLKEQLRRIKQQNKLLIQIIKINQLKTHTTNNTNKCTACGCSCSARSNKEITQFDCRRDT